jgi:hypothetical protein
MAVVKGSALLSSVEALFENTESIVIAAFQVCAPDTHTPCVQPDFIVIHVVSASCCLQQGVAAACGSCAHKVPQHDSTD